MRTHEKRVRFMRHTQQRQHRNHMISKYTMYQQHEITHYGQHKTRLLKKDTKPHKSYKIYTKIIQDDDIGENKDGAKKKINLEISTMVFKNKLTIPDIHQVALPYTTSFAASDPSHPSSAVTHGGRPAWRWSLDAVAYTRRKPATAGCCCVFFCL